MGLFVRCYFKEKNRVFKTLKWCEFKLALQDI